MKQAHKNTLMLIFIIILSLLLLLLLLLFIVDYFLGHPVPEKIQVVTISGHDIRVYKNENGERKILVVPGNKRKTTHCTS